MSWAYVPGQAGVRTAKTARHKIIYRGGNIANYLPEGRQIDGILSRDPTNSDDVTVLQAGLLMGKVTSSGLYAPAILGVTTAVTAAGAVAITAGAATVTELVRRIGASGTFKLTGPPTANGVTQTETVTYSVASGTTITCTATMNAYVSGAFIQPTDGSDQPLVPIPDSFGIPVTEIDGTAVASIQFAEIPLDATLISANLVNWPSDTSLQAWIMSRLNDIGGGHYIFDHRY